MKRVRVEFHCHSIYSKDSLLDLESLLRACQRKKIDRVVITDHNTILGALRAQKMDPRRVILGEEIMTQAGELLAIFVKEEIPAGLPAREALARLREQEAFISVSHPFDWMRKGHWEREDLEEILPWVDAIETFNARCLWPGFNQRARQFAERHAIAGTVGSDAHAAFELGKATLHLPDFHDRNSLVEALKQAEEQVSLSAPWAHLSSRWAAWRKKRARQGNPIEPLS
jgi:predicted metal-dependent phosphoesterase TrpH